MKIQYLCESWQGFIQQIVFLVSRGYYFHCVTIFPEAKREKWEQIDAKLFGKYQAEKSKWQRSRAKIKGIANFYYLRWEHLAIIMHTAGEIIPDIVYDDDFKDIRNKKGRIHLQISDLVGLEVYMGDFKEGGVQKPTVKLDKVTYTGFKDSIEDVINTKNIGLIIKEFDKINGIPAWSGIIKQKRNLANFLVRKVHQHQLPLNNEQLRINTYRKPVKVFL